MITVKNLSFSYSQLPFIENMNFQVRSGEIFGFLGPSGAGKSTLQKILIGMLPKYKGSVSINNNEIRNKSDQFYESIGVDFEFPRGRKINCVMRRFFPSSSVGDRPAPRGCTSTPDERKVTTI